MKDHSRGFEDERLWATHRQMWHFKQWWLRVRLPLIGGAIVATYLLASYYDERERRGEADQQADIMAVALMSNACAQDLPTGRAYLVASDHPRLADDALKGLVTQIDQLRLGLLVAATRELPKELTTPPTHGVSMANTQKVVK